MPTKILPTRAAYLTMSVSPPHLYSRACLLSLGLRKIVIYFTSVVTGSNQQPGTLASLRKLFSFNNLGEPMARGQQPAAHRDADRQKGRQGASLQPPQRSTRRPEVNSPTQNRSCQFTTGLHASRLTRGTFPQQYRRTMLNECVLKI